MMASSSYMILLLLLPAFLANHSMSADETMISIDCGASGTYSEASINWTGDRDMIQTGESFEVDATEMPQAMSTLRAFTTRKKNCYSINAEKGTRYLLRASFYYGNYDKKASPPIFDLHFDGNHWTTVATSLDSIYFHEAIYTAKGDIISVCLAQISPNMFPFISSLEVRTLTPTMYSQVESDYGLILSWRLAFGTKNIVKYPNDVYDRIWLPANKPGVFIDATSNAIIDNTGLDDNPPTAVLQNAIVARNTSSIIILKTGVNSNVEVPIYVSMYFSEVELLSTTEERSFELFINDKVDKGPIVPPYGKAVQRSWKGFATSNTNLSLQATSTSTLPPLINALEVYTITDELTDGTFADDVEALNQLQKVFEALQDWNGDPCLPTPFTWDWLNCSSDSTPRVTALYLSGYGLSGSLPDFSSMDALETIDLQNNSLNGPIPDFLGTLPKLKTLNLADNDFSGPVPSSLLKNTNVKLTVTGNPDLCTSGKSCKSTNTNKDTNTNRDTNTDSGSSANDSPSGKEKKSSKLPVILGASAAALVIFFIVLGSLAVLHQKRKSAAVAAATTGQGPYTGGSGPDGRVMGQEMKGNANQNMVNEFMVNIHDQGQGASNQTNHRARAQAHREHDDLSSKDDE